MGALAERPVDHAGLAVLAYDECLRLLREQLVGRVAFYRGGEVEVFPITFVLESNVIGFRTAYGSKLGAAVENSVVTFEIDGFDPDSHSGWSVVVKGRADTDIDDATLAALDATGFRPWADAAASGNWVIIRPVEVTGRRIQAAAPAAEPAAPPAES